MAGVMVASNDDSTFGVNFIKIGIAPGTPLFDVKSDSQYSSAFTVPTDGSGILLSAFDLCTDLIIEKLAFDAQFMPNGRPSCRTGCKPTPKETPATYSSNDRIEQNGNWIMGRDANTGLLVVPGTYRVYACDENALGSFQLKATKIAQVAVQNIPGQLVFGNTL